MADGQALAAPWISTPGFLKDRAARLHSALHSLNETISALAGSNRLSTDSAKWKQWKRFLDAWGKWYGETSDFTWLWSGTDATLETYEKQFQTWERWVRQAFPDTAPDLPEAPPTYGPGGVPRVDVPWWVWGLGAVAVGYGVVTFVKKL